MREIVKQTTDYSKFHYIKGNRGLDESKILDMADSISRKNFLREFPIVVNSSFGVIDGQHRLEAAKLANVPIFYIVSEKIKVEDIAEINRTIKKWTIDDYVILFSTKNKIEYQKLLAIKDSWNLPLHIVLRIFGLDSGAKTEQIKSGNFFLSKKVKEEGYSFYEKLKTFMSIYKYWHYKGFLDGFRILSKHPLYDHDVMRQKLSYQSRSLVRCATSKDYAELLLSIYNNKNQNKIKYLDSEDDLTGE